MSQRKVYPSDLNDAEWSIFEPYIPAVKNGGRAAKYSRREIVNAILYVLRGGIAWRMMPHDLPAWDTVYAYYNRWRKAGVWERIHHVLYTQLRIEMGRQSQTGDLCSARC